MKNTLFILLILPVVLFAQSELKEFKSEDIEISFTKYLVGCMNDPDNTKGENLTYELKGQIFGDGEFIIKPETKYSSTNKETPFLTLAEMMFAFKAKDADKIVKLYDKASKAKAKSIYKGSNSVKILSGFSKVESIEILMGFEYQDGYLVILDAEGIGVNINYLIKQKGKWYLSALNDQNPTSWNLALYWKYLPKPLITPTIVSNIDSLQLDDFSALNFQLTNNGNWITIFKPKNGEPTLFTVEDNGKDDTDSRAGFIEIQFVASRLLSKGTYKLRMVESNYPISQVHEYIIPKSIEHTIKVY